MGEFASANTGQILRVEEVTYGVTPTTPTLIETRMTGESLDFAREVTISEELRSDRQRSGSTTTSASASGSIDHELSYGTYDDFFESAFYNAWSTPLAISSADIDTTAGGLTDSGAGAAFTSVVVGQWIKVDGFVANSGENNLYYKVIAKADNDNITTQPAPPSIEVSAGTITADGSQLVGGSTQKSFTMERRFTDLDAGTVFEIFNGMIVDTFSLSFENGSILGGSFGFIGSDFTASGTTIPGSTDQAATTTDVLNAVGNLLDIRIDGVASTDCFLSLSVDYANNLREQRCIGSIATAGIGTGTIDATGSIELYLRNRDEIDRFTGDAPFSISFRLQDNAGNAYVLEMGNVKYTALPHSITGLDSDVTLSGEYQAFRDPLSGNTISIHRFPAP